MRANPSLIPRFNVDYKLGDFIYGLKHIFQNDIPDLDILKSLFGHKDFFFTNNGRSSLYVILKSLNLPKGSKVGVPLYSCTVVFDAIIMAGCVPLFIDIDLYNYTLDLEDLKNKIDDISAVIVIHTFGRPADMVEIKKIAENISIIEDCSHSILSEYNGQLTGTLGDVAFFSLAKYISAGGGGMIVINNNKLRRNIDYNIHLLSSNSISSEFIHSIFTYMYSLLYHKPWYGGFAFQIGSYIKNDVDITSTNTFKVTTIRKTDLNIFLKKLTCFKEKVELQRENSQLLISELKNSSLILPYERKNTWCNYFYFPILLANKEKRDRAYEFLNNRGVDTAKLFSTIPTIARKSYEYKDDCLNAENLADRILIIPNYYALKNSDLSKVITSIKLLEGFNENNGGSRTS